MAQHGVLQASILTKQVQSSVGEIIKEDDSQVTMGDFAAQAILIGLLHHTFPNDRFVGEETSAVLRGAPDLCGRVYDLVQTVTAKMGHQPTSTEEMLTWIDLGGRGPGGDKGRIWVLDPIDGTAAFLRGQQYAVSLSLINDGQEVLGVLGCPNISSNMTRISETDIDHEGFGIMLSAVRGRGVTIRSMAPEGLGDPTPLSFPLDDCLSDKNLHIVGCTACEVTRHDHISRLAREFNTKFPNTEIWSSHIRYAALILGTGNVQFWIPKSSESKLHIWDHAGSQLIFTEMGGKVTDLDGRSIEFGAGRDLYRNRGLVVARGEIHQKLLKAINDIYHAVESSK
ncbi:hypothetical protein LTR84_005624 [Exophiala bonariae]|uniref:3'(2'),5'-bisphosphate nucleotidase n=1 Tax=Exophiala bonariae TaxID=1690606 RepID=A0AAV9N436_9EURO|nr:hypothetical protein LTR84_005624 [Exophiala bonariae]